MPKRTYSPKSDAALACTASAHVHALPTVAPCCAAGVSRAGIGSLYSQRLLAALNAAGFPQPMQRQHRLGSTGRISEIHRRGRSVANGLLVMRVLPNDLDRSRFCFVTGKRVGNAVVRNRVSVVCGRLSATPLPLPGGTPFSSRAKEPAMLISSSWSVPYTTSSAAPG